MTKIMKIEKEIVMKAAREIYEGDLEAKLRKASKQALKPFCQKVLERLLANLEKENPGKHFLIGKESRTKKDLADKIGCILKG